MDQNNYNYIYQSRKEMLDFVPQSCLKILEVGCGDGSFSVQLKDRKDTEVWGVEMHEESASIALQRLDKVLCGNFLELMETQKLPANYFDCIVFNDVLEHFLNYDEILSGIKKLLKVNAYVVTSLPNFRYVGNLWEIIIRKDFQYKSSGVLDYTHYRFFTAKSIQRMYSESGFEVRKSYGINGTRSIKVRILNLLTFNFFSDIYYMQIATLAQLK
ncbi:MAG: class I SAM-dependent methyltransferase [Bacteroidales bacterium]|nr:class I SAM-dependent methyltransferase [Bacteroidales bacterium]